LDIGNSNNPVEEEELLELFELLELLELLEPDDCEVIIA